MERLLLRPDRARALLVLAHGAGAGMEHPFMESLTQALAERDVATLRYNFPYKETGGKGWPPDPPEILVETVAAAMEAAQEEAPDLPLFAGGKSLGGRMTSTAAAAGQLPEALRGLVFFGFPLHGKGRPSTKRARHLVDVSAPMLFLQGTRDELADLELLRPVVEELGDRATFQVLEGADHGFHVLKRSGRTDGEVLEELADRAARWMEENL